MSACDSFFPKRPDGPLSRRCINCTAHYDEHKKNPNDRSIGAKVQRPKSSRIPGAKAVSRSASYMFPATAEKRKNELVVFVNPASVPNRTIMYLVKLFDLPVDLCGTDFGKHLHSAEALKENPIHTLPFMTHYAKDGKTTSVNGSEGILHFLLKKFEDELPATFWPEDPLEQAAVMSKFHFINNTLYRATMYQYVYPLGGYMASCQYDLSKTDIAMETVESWCQAGSKVHGDSLTPADLVLYALQGGCNWTKTIKDLPWQWDEALTRYPHMKRVLDSVGDEKAIRAVDNMSFKEGDVTLVSLNHWNEHPEFWQMKKTLPKGREFVRTRGQPYYTAVAYGDEQTKKDFDKEIV